MSDRIFTPEEQSELASIFAVPLESLEELVDWVDVFLGIRLPVGHVDPESNSSPGEWLWEAYNNYKNNKGNEIPGYIILSSRDSYKTLSETILNLLLMIHFKATIAHLAAVESQAYKAIQYVNSFIKKCEPYLNANNISVDTQSKRRISLMHPDGSVAYVNIIIATLQGANSEHTNVLSVDEIDVMRFPDAYEEAMFIPGVVSGKYPLKIKTSTRKFAFGLMEKELQKAQSSGEKILRWNILDVTEKIPPEISRPDLPRVPRYIHYDLPLRNLSVDEYNKLPEEQKNGFKLIEAYAGIAESPLLPVMENRLADRPDTDVGGLYKPMDFVLNQFASVSLEKAEAQLLCRKPTKEGIVYPRFTRSGNVISLNDAYNQIADHPYNGTISLDSLISLMQQKDIKFYAGVDWGSTHPFAITISSLVNGEWWFLETYSASNFEFDEMMLAAKRMRDKYNPVKWFADTAEPMFIKEFKKNRMNCIDFKKDVSGGIEMTRRAIVDSKNIRRLKVLDTPENDFLIKGFEQHHFKLDSAGKPTSNPDDGLYADIMDTVRYQAQNLIVSGTGPIISGSITKVEESQQEYQQKASEKNKNWLSSEINKSVEESTGITGTVTSKSKGIFWNFD